MENLLAMPVRPIEVMLAKVVPYIVIGYVQVVPDHGDGGRGVRPADPRIRCRCWHWRSGCSSPATWRWA